MRKSNLSYISIQTNLMCHFFVKYLVCILLSLFGVIEGVNGAINDHSEVVLTRDRAGRIVEESQDGHTVTSSFAKTGLRNKITSSLGADISVDYTAAGMVSAMATDGWQMSAKYDSRGLEIEREMSGEVSSTYEYDNIGRIARHRVRRPSKRATR